jgi:hypothetical protein
MKTLKRALVAVLAIAGSVHAAQPPAARPGATLERVPMVTRSTQIQSADVAVELDQRVHELEEELARVRAQEDERVRLRPQPDPTFFDG